MRNRGGPGRRRLAGGLALLLAGLSILIGAPAQAEPLVDRAQLEAWADSYYGQAIAEKRTAGITVSVVQDGQVIFAKGYGYADYAKKIPVDAQNTGFIVGSITKTFLATAIGQLLDRGAIASLDDPANMYLKRIQLPGARGAKVTIRQLLNHRAGFEDIDFGFLAKPMDPHLPMSPKEIKRFMPAIAMEPGGMANYSNWSFSVLGLLIEDVTGQRLDAYLKANIWAPLGMTHTSMVYGKYPDNLAKNYVFETDGRPVSQPRHLPHPWISPAGTIVSTAADMGLYMRAQVLRGEDGGYPLVRPETFKLLQTETYRNAPISIGFAHAFWTMRLNGAQTVEHGGGAPGFQSMMVMIPGKRFGFFASTMQGGLAPWASYTPAQEAAGHLTVQGAPTGFELRESFIDRFLKRDPVPSGGAKTDLSLLPGVYWTQKRPFTNLEILGQAFNPAAVLKVSLSADGKGVMLNDAGPYRDIGGGVFVSPTGRDTWTDPYTIDQFKPSHIAFAVKDGKVAYLTPGLADQAWVPASPIFNPQTMLLGFVALGALAVSGAFLALWPRPGRLSDPATYLGLGAALAVLAIPAAIFLGFARGDSLVDQMAVGEKGRFWIMVIAANLMALLTAGLVARTIWGWSKPAHEGEAGWARTGLRLHLSLVSLASVGVLVVFWFFRLLGLHMPG